MGNKYYFCGSGKPELFKVSEDGTELFPVTEKESLESELFLKMELLKKRIYKLEWIIAILVSILFSIGYLFLLKLCIWWLL